MIHRRVIGMQRHKDPQLVVLRLECGHFTVRPVSEQPEEDKPPAVTICPDCQLAVNPQPQEVGTGH